MSYFSESPLLEDLVSELRQYCAVEGVEIMPQIIFVDGSGVLHPRGVGLATHLGLRVGIPTVGIGTSRGVQQPLRPSQPVP